MGFFFSSFAAVSKKAVCESQASCNVLLCGLGKMSRTENIFTERRRAHITSHAWDLALLTSLDAAFLTSLAFLGGAYFEQWMLDLRSLCQRLLAQQKDQVLRVNKYGVQRQKLLTLLTTRQLLSSRVWEGGVVTSVERVQLYVHREWFIGRGKRICQKNMKPTRFFIFAYGQICLFCWLARW